MIVRVMRTVRACCSVGRTTARCSQAASGMRRMTAASGDAPLTGPVLRSATSEYDAGYKREYISHIMACKSFS